MTGRDNQDDGVRQETRPTPENPDLSPGSLMSRNPVAGIGAGLVDGTAFFSAIISGMLLGLVADHFLGTTPWLVVIGVLAGTYTGFVGMWRASKPMEQPRRERET